MSAATQSGNAAPVDLTDVFGWNKLRVTCGVNGGPLARVWAWDYLAVRYVENHDLSASETKAAIDLATLPADRREVAAAAWRKAMHDTLGNYDRAAYERLFTGVK